MNATIRLAGPQDAKDIHRLIRELAIYEREPDAVEATPESLREQLAQDHPPFQCLLAEEGGEAVAFALFFRNYSTWRGRPGLYLEDLFVAPHARGRGLGRRLFVELARRAVEGGCARMEWAVLDWNASALGFYERMGARALQGWTLHRLTDEPLRALARSPR